MKLIVADYLAALLAWILFYALRKYILHEMSEGISFFLLGSAVMIATFWLLLYTLIGQYRDIFRKSRVKEITNLAQISFLGAIIIFFALLLDDEGVENYRSYYKTISTYFLLHFLITGIFRTITITSIKKLIRQGKISFNTLIVGSNANAREVYLELEKNNRHLGLKILGYLHVFQAIETLFVNELKNLGYYQKLPELIKKHNIEEVIIAIEPSEHKKIEEILGLMEGENVRISILPDLYQILLGSVKVNHLFGTPLIEIKQNLMPVWQEVLKRVIDVVASALFLLIFFPVYAMIAAMVKLSSPGPVFYKQERIGKHGKPFYIYKFRSMFIDAEKLGPSLSSDYDPRITSWGRFMRKVRLDELPQFWNVIIGDMSLVGPRPERQFFIDQIVKIAPHYKHLHRVRPGITSLGQVKYGYASSVDEMVRRLKFDILYIENMSLAMDFRVMLYTIKIIVEGRGK
ncbi:sugar transferase [Adhaeribacter sp. BT258]|uniref:Sugar transferase n=1 Tax=Adhaeribacter terrigena TaxID=2793070 RepID=A0ABS1C0J4_9BACT|nr:sugar transferase [Adhaeribacter terrigena]